MSNSPLVDCKALSPNNSGRRTSRIERITPHCVVGQLSAEGIGGCFASPSSRASCNYGIGRDGRVVLVVDESKRSWCSSSSFNDNRAVTIECASSHVAPYTMNDAVYSKLTDLCTDICKRNGIKKLLWFNSKYKTLYYRPKKDEAVITVHRWYANKACPGDWLYNRLGDLADEVTVRLNSPAHRPTPTGVMYRVQTGAFKSKANAEALASKVKASGFDTVVVYDKGLYKVQVGAFSKFTSATAYADKVRKAGYGCMVTVKGIAGHTPTTPIKVGNLVYVKPGAKTYTGGNVASFVYKRYHVVDAISGTRVLLDKNGICTPFNITDLVKKK